MEFIKNRMMQSVKAKAKVVLPRIMLFIVIWVTCSASYADVFSWVAFRDQIDCHTIDRMVEGTAYRPFVYRQLVPQTAHFIREHLPEKTEQKLQAQYEKTDLNSNPYALPSIYARSTIPREYAIEYYLIYGITFLCFFASTWILRSILMEVLKDRVAGTLTALLFVLLFPFFTRAGAFFYDFSEMLFFFLAIKFAMHGRWITLLCLTPFAVWNKESFFFFLLTLLPFHRAHVGMKKALLLTLGLLLIAGLSYLPVHWHYAMNPGGTVEYHFWDHVANLFSWKSYWQVTRTYGTWTGSGVFLPHVLLLVWMIFHVWKQVPSIWKQHMGIACAINLPLYWMFCWLAELRNLSFLYFSFCIIMGFWIRETLWRLYQPPAAGEGK